MVHGDSSCPGKVNFRLRLYRAVEAWAWCKGTVLNCQRIDAAARVVPNLDLIFRVSGNAETIRRRQFRLLSRVSG
jgi:hypothetical protein